eukprot:998390_1
MTKQRDATKDELVSIKKTIFQKNDEKAKCQLDAENAMKKLNMRKMESDLQLKQTKNKNTILAKNLATRKKETGQLDHRHKKDVKDHEDRVHEVIRRHEQFMERKEIAIKKQNSFIDSHEETREKNLKILKKAAEALVEVNKSKMEAHKHVRELEREGLKYADVLKKAKSSAKEKQTMLDECKLKLATRRCRLEEESLELASLKGEEQHLKSSHMQLLAQLSELKRRERLRISRKVDGCVQVCIRGVDVGVNTMVDESMFSKFLTNPVLRPHKLNFPPPEWYESPIMLEAPESCHTTGRLVPESVQHTGEMSRDYGLSTDKMSPEYGQITGERQRSPEYGQSTDKRSPEYGQLTGMLTYIDDEEAAGALKEECPIKSIKEVGKSKHLLRTSSSFILQEIGLDASKYSRTLTPFPLQSAIHPRREVIVCHARTGRDGVWDSQKKQLRSDLGLPLSSARGRMPLESAPCRSPVAGLIGGQSLGMDIERFQQLSAREIYKLSRHRSSLTRQTNKSILKGTEDLLARVRPASSMFRTPHPPLTPQPHGRMLSGKPPTARRLGMLTARRARSLSAPAQRRTRRSVRLPGLVNNYRNTRQQRTSSIIEGEDLIRPSLLDLALTDRTISSYNGSGQSTRRRITDGEVPLFVKRRLR